MSLSSVYKGHKIVLTQKGPNIAAKVGGVNVVIDAKDAKDALAQAKQFIDEQTVEVAHKPKGIAIKGEVS